MKNNKNISFIIPAYNCEKTITETIESIFNGNFYNGDEIIIINDASTDKTLEIAIGLKSIHPEIKIYSHNINKGSAAASRNTGIDNSTNDLIFCLDADNVLEPKSIEKLKGYLFDQKADISTFGEIHYFIKNIKEITHKWIYKKEIELQDALSGDYWPGPSGNYLFTKESWLKAGRYNESIGGAYDSWAFGIKQLATGAKMVALRNSHYFHRCGYDSTFVRDEKKLKPSIIGLCTLLPFLHLIDESDVEYIMSKENRENWLENLKNRPIKTRIGKAGLNGGLITKNNTKTFFMGRIKHKIMNVKNIILRQFKKRETENIQSKRVIPWVEIHGDKTLRLDYPLNENSLIIDVGGYEGQWASDIFAKYCCNIIIFEPVKKFYDNIKERFIKNNKISSYNVGLSNKDNNTTISLLDDSSSLFKKDSMSENIKTVNASVFLKEKNIHDIDLMKINIEGSEYDLLENLIESGFILKIKNIQVQFHDFIPNARERMTLIQEKLKKTHHLTYQYEFVWENWEINNK